VPKFIFTNSKLMKNLLLHCYVQMRCDLYEQKHWEHQEKLLIRRHIRYNVQFVDNDCVPVSSLNTPRLHVDVPTPSLSALPTPPQPGYDDIDDEIFPTGPIHSVKKKCEN
jgi:hypothetical protein